MDQVVVQACLMMVLCETVGTSDKHHSPVNVCEEQNYHKVMTAPSTPLVQSCHGNHELAMTPQPQQHALSGKSYIGTYERSRPVKTNVYNKNSRPKKKLKGSKSQRRRQKKKKKHGVAKPKKKRRPK